MFALIFGSGVWVGLNMADPPTEYVTEERVVTKTEVKTVEVPAKLPQSCLDAAHYADVLTKAAEVVDDASFGQLDILSDARELLIEGNTSKLNQLETKQRQMESKTLGAVATIAETKQPYNEARIKCAKETR